MLPAILQIYLWKNICKKEIPFFFAGILADLFMTYFPQISLFLPDLLGM